MANPVENGFLTAAAVTPTDALKVNYRSLWIGVGGTLAVRDSAGVLVATTVPVGLFPLSVTEVLLSGTAATGILGLN